MLAALIAIVSAQFPLDAVPYRSPEAYQIEFRKAWLDTVAVKVRVKDKDAWFLLDTGAAASYLTRKMWKSLGLPSDEESIGLEVSCGTVTALVDLGKVPEGLESANEQYKMRIDGILGLDFLEGCAVGLDRPSGALVLFPPRVLGPERMRMFFGSVAYVKDGKTRWMPWTTSAHSVGEKDLSPIAFEGTQLGAQVFDTPRIERNLAATFVVGGVKMDCVFDTGACPTTLLEAPIKSQVRYEGDKVVNYSINGTQYIGRGRLDSLKLGEFELIPTGGMTVCTTDNPVLEGQGLVGIDVMSRNKTLLDFENRTVSFARYTRSSSSAVDSSRYFRCEIYDPSTQQVLRFHAGATLPFRQGDIVLSGSSRVKVVSAKAGLTTLRIE